MLGIDTCMKKVIWLVNKHAAPIKYNATNMRTYKLAYYFTQFGYEAYVISSSFIHNKNIDLLDSNEQYAIKEYDGVKFVHVKSLHYKSNGLKRILSISQFSRRLLKLRHELPKPNVIIHTSNIPFDYWIYTCARKLDAKYLIEVVDLWPESFVAFGLIGKKNPLLSLMYKVEKLLYARADKLIFSMEGGRDYIIEKKWDKGNGGPIDLSKVYYLNNGVDAFDFEQNKRQYKLEDAILEDTKLKKVVYLGSIRKANNLKWLIDAASYLKRDKSVVFLIYGDGDERPVLESYAKDLDNVLFKEKWIEPQYVPYVLCSSYINIINYMPNAIERYGGSQNKLFQALASGRPVCSNIGMGYSIINKYKVGIDKRFADAREYAQAIKSLLSLPQEEYDAMCERARDAAKEFDLKNLAKFYSEHFIKDI